MQKFGSLDTVSEKLCQGLLYLPQRASSAVESLVSQDRVYKSTNY